MPLSHGCDLRKGRTSIPNQVYLVTTVTHNREPLFVDFHFARTVINSIRYIDLTQQTITQAFVVMPDHLHWLFTLGNTAELSQAVANLKRRSAFRINALRCRTGTPLWQKGFHDYALRKEDEMKAAARYIVANPLRAGLVRNIGDYPFWDAVWLNPVAE